MPFGHTRRVLWLCGVAAYASHDELLASPIRPSYQPMVKAIQKNKRLAPQT